MKSVRIIESANLSPAYKKFSTRRDTAGEYMFKVIDKNLALHYLTRGDRFAESVES